jgi:hypothetical protein
LTDAHRPALEYDWRARFNMSLDSVGSSMSYGEAVRLSGVLAADPSSHLAASLAGWKAPRSFEWLVLADLFDAFCRANYERPTAYPRPFRDSDETHRGQTDRPRAEVIDLLNRHGHDFDSEE